MTFHQPPHLSPPIMSPPQSVQSSHSLSPPGHAQNTGHQTSPHKGRGMMLPTSPTHMAAMRGASHQRHQSFDFPDSQGGGGQLHPALLQQGMYPYLPTPPQADSTVQQQNFMTPSPDSPGQWSSASPQSHSDWSEGVHSPTTTFQQLKQNPGGLQQAGQDAVFI